VLEGSLDVLIGGEWRTLTEGATAAVAPGTVHTFRVGDSPVRVRNVHHPALDFEPYIKRLCSAANERRLGDLSSVRALCTSPSSCASSRFIRGRRGDFSTRRRRSWRRWGVCLGSAPADETRPRERPAVTQGASEPL